MDGIRLRECNTNRTWESDRHLSIGRAASQNVVLDDHSVSRRHAEVGLNDNGYCIVLDLGSTNGTFVNGYRLAHGENHELWWGDLLRFGNVNFCIEGASIASATVGNVNFCIEGASIESAAEWETCRWPLRLLSSFPTTAWVDSQQARKLRLWVLSCLCRYWKKEVPFSSGSFLSTALRRAQALIDLDPVEAAPIGQELIRGVHEWEARGGHWDLGIAMRFVRLMDALLTFDKQHRSITFRVVVEAWLLRWPSLIWHPESAVDADLVRCLVGNPWHQPLIDQTWLQWNGGVIPGLAQGIYADGSFGELPVLADALEESGCTDEYLLGHLRSGLHCRGCHALDAVLGRHPAFPTPG